MDIGEVAASIEEELRSGATPERAMGEKRYLKSDLEFLGATVPAIRQATRRVWREHPDLSRTRVTALARRLWKPGVHELRVAAASILELYVDRLTPGDCDLLERFLRESRTWALVDPLAISVVGPLAARESAVADRLDRWVTDDNFWVRRAALLALLKPLRDGTGDFARFSRYADPMLEEREFFIRKAIGWVLRETSKSRPDLVQSWVGPRTHRMSGVTIREAVKKLPPAVAESYLAAYKAKQQAVVE